MFEVKTFWTLSRIIKYALMMTLIIGFISLKIRADLEVIRTDIFLTSHDSSFLNGKEQTVKLAIVSDLHIHNSEKSYSDLSTLVQEVLASTPDFILLLGDYTQLPSSIDDLSQHRMRVSKILGELDKVPTLAVLGNYENWSEPRRWSASLNDQGIDVLENEVIKATSGDQVACFRGLGDAFTGRLIYIDFPDGCRELPKITLTHDPAGAFYKNVQGVVFAGHTHCGQVRLPIFGSMWVPTKAPKEATCGLYKDDHRLLWVSSGVGYSLLPIRFGAKAQWDLVSLAYSAH